MTGDQRRALAIIERLAALGFLFVLALGVLGPASPRFQKLPSFDSGVFLYTGWRVTEGALPYRDVWDHKPPLIFYIDAVGLLLDGGSRWGVWGLEVVSLVAAAAIAFSLLQRALGSWAAIYASVAWMVNAFVTMDGGNYTTEYALPLQFGVLWLCGTAQEGPFSARRSLGLGILGGLLFWLKQNDIGIPLAITVFVALQIVFGTARRANALSLAAMGGGVLLVSILVILPFAIQGAVSQFWEAAFLFNFIYVEETWLNRVLVLRYVPVYLPAMGLTLYAVLGWSVAALTLLNAALSKQEIWRRWGDALETFRGDRSGATANGLTREQMVRLFAVALVALPIELVLVSVAGNEYDHYFLALLPVLALLGAFTFRLVLALLERIVASRLLIAVFGTVFVTTLLLLTVEDIQPILVRVVYRQNDLLVSYLERNSGTNDSVFIWDGESRLLFESRRRAPTRFIYLAPVVRARYSSPEKVGELVGDLLARPPRLILIKDASLDSYLEFPFRSPAIDSEVAQIRASYQVKDHVGDWTVLERRAP